MTDRTEQRVEFSHSEIKSLTFQRIHISSVVDIQAIEI